MGNKQYFDQLEIKDFNGVYIWAINNEEKIETPLDCTCVFSDQIACDSFVVGIQQKSGGDFHYRYEFKTNDDAKKYMDYISTLLSKLDKLK